MFDAPMCFVCEEPAVAQRSSGEMCLICTTAFDSNDTATLLRRNNVMERESKEHTATPDDDSRHCVVCRKRITRVGFESWSHE